MERRKNLLFSHLRECFETCTKHNRTVENKILFINSFESLSKPIKLWGKDILQELRTPENEKWVWANSKYIQLDNRVLCFFFYCDLWLTQFSGRETQNKNMISKIDYEWWCWEMIIFTCCIFREGEIDCSHSVASLFESCRVFLFGRDSCADGCYLFARGEKQKWKSTHPAPSVRLFPCGSPSQPH